MSINRPKRASTRTVKSSSSDHENRQTPAVDWTKSVSGKPESSFKSYGVKETYAMGDFVQHTKFGPGVVVGVEPSKVDILFETGSKKLVHAME